MSDMFGIEMIGGNRRIDAMDGPVLSPRWGLRFFWRHVTRGLHPWLLTGAPLGLWGIGPGISACRVMGGALRGWRRLPVCRLPGRRSRRRPTGENLLCLRHTVRPRTANRCYPPCGAACPRRRTFVGLRTQD
jgi:hypothetical protein